MKLNVTCINPDNNDKQFIVYVGERSKIINKNNPSADFEIPDKGEYKIKVNQLPHNCHGKKNIVLFALTALLQSFYYIFMYYFKGEIFEYNDINPFYIETGKRMYIDHSTELMFDCLPGIYNHNNSYIKRPVFIEKSYVPDETRYIFNRTAFRNKLYLNLKKDISAGLLCATVIAAPGAAVVAASQSLAAAAIFAAFVLLVLGATAWAVVHDFNRFTYACNTAGILRESK